MFAAIGRMEERAAVAASPHINYAMTRHRTKRDGLIVEHASPFVRTAIARSSWPLGPIAIAVAPC